MCKRAVEHGALPNHTSVDDFSKLDASASCQNLDTEISAELAQELESWRKRAEKAEREAIALREQVKDLSIQLQSQTERADKIFAESVTTKNKTDHDSKRAKKLLVQLKKMKAENDQAKGNAAKEHKQLRDALRRAHPVTKRLHNLGNNVEELVDLEDRWAGIVFGRISSSMLYSNVQFKEVFHKYAQRGQLDEESFCSVLKQFEPKLKKDRLTRLWHYADEDGSGQLDILEFMRIFGIDANGEMLEEYWQLIMTRVWKGLQNRGGLRRVLAEIDRCHDGTMKREDFSMLLQPLKLDLTRLEETGLFRRLDVAGEGHVNLMDLEEALLRCSSSSLVTESWAKEVFDIVARKLQAEGLSIRDAVLVSQTLTSAVSSSGATALRPSSVTQEQFSMFLSKFLPMKLKQHQVERLFSFIDTKHHGYASMEYFLQICLNPSLGGTDVRGGDGAHEMPADVLERFATTLVRRFGDLAQAFDQLRPVIPFDVFLQSLKTCGMAEVSDPKQLFNLLDLGRDSYIDRDEFQTVLENLSNQAKNSAKDEVSFGRRNSDNTRRGSDDSDSGSVGGDDGGGASNRKKNHKQQSGANRFGMRRESVAVRRQSIGMTRGSVADSSNKRRKSMVRRNSQSLAGTLLEEVPSDGDDSPRQTSKGVTHENCANCFRLMNRVTCMENEICKLRAYTMVGDHDSLEWQARAKLDLLCNSYNLLLRSRNDKASVSDVVSRRSQIVVQGTKSQQALQRASIAASPSEAARRIENLNEEIRSLRISNELLGRRLQELHAERLFAREESQTSQQVQGAPSPTSSESMNSQTFSRREMSRIKPSIGMGIVVEDEDDESLTASFVAADANQPIDASTDLQGNFSRSESEGTTSLQHRRTALKFKKRDTMKTSTYSHKMSTRSYPSGPTGMSRGLSEIDIGNEAAEVQENSPYHKLEKEQKLLSRALASLAENDKWHEFKETVVGHVSRGRYLIMHASLLNDRLMLQARDVLLNRMVDIRCPLYNDPIVNASDRQQFVRAMQVASLLEDVPEVVKIHYFSGTTENLCLAILERLEGTTLDVLFRGVHRQKGVPMSALQAAEIADSLLTGMHAAHRRGVLHMNMRPVSVWVLPALSGCPVRILDWGLAQILATAKSGGRISEALEVTSKSNPKGSESIQMYGTCPRLRVVKTRINEEEPESPPATQSRTSESPFCAVDLQKHDSQQTGFQSSARNGELLGNSTKTLQALKTCGFGVAPGIQAEEADCELIDHIVLRGVGCPNYMAPERFAQFIRTHQRSASKAPELFEPIHLSAESASRGVKISQKGDTASRSNVAERVQKADFFLLAENPLPLGPQGRYFQVEPHFGPMEVTEKEKESSDASLCPMSFAIGFSSIAPCDLPGSWDRNESFPQTSPEVWLVGCEDKAWLAGQQYSFPNLPQLRRGDHVGVLADYSGHLVVYVNAVEVASIQGHLDSSTRLFPAMMIPNCSRCQTRSLTTVPLQPGHPVCQPLPEYQAQAKLIHDASPPSIASDVYSCARVIARCFMPGGALRPSPSLAQFLLALDSWISPLGCPVSDHAYPLLHSLVEITKEPTSMYLDELGETNSEIQEVLDKALCPRATERTPTCDALRLALNAATGWYQMDSNFLCSHTRAIEEQTMEILVEKPEESGTTSPKKSARMAKMKKMEEEEEEPMLQLGNVHWDLRPFVLGPSHLRRVMDVLKDPNLGPKFGTVSLSEFEQTEHLESTVDLSEFAACFRNWPTEDYDDEDYSMLPKLCFYDQELPIESLPSYVWQKVVKHHGWLVLSFVRTLELSTCLEGNPLGDFGLQEISQALYQNTSLLKLILHGQQITDEGVRFLAPALEANDTLQHLDLSGNPIGFPGMDILASSLKENASVDALDLSRCNLEDKGAAHVADLMADSSNIRRLNLSSNGIGSEGAKQIAEALMVNMGLTQLNLGHNVIGEEGVSALMLATTVNKVLEQLSLQQNKMCPLATHTVAGYIMGTAVSWSEESDHKEPVVRFSNLRELRLRRCNVGSHGAKEIFTALRKAAPLKCLDLGWNEIGGNSGYELAQLLADRNGKIEELDLRDNYLGEGDVWPNELQHVFTSHLGSTGGRKNSLGLRILNTTLKRLQLANNRFTSSGASKLAEALPSLEELETLELYNNPDIGHVGIQRLAHSLEVSRKHCSLSTLNVAICNIGDDGAKALSDVLCTNNRITVLDASDNNISDRGAMAFADSLRFNQALRSLRLKLNHIGSLGAEQFQQVLGVSGAALSLEEVDLSANNCSAGDLVDKHPMAKMVDDVEGPGSSAASDTDDLAGESSVAVGTASHIQSSHFKALRDPMQVLRF